MKLSEVKEILDATVYCGDMDAEVFAGCGSDLMSDVLAFVKEKVLLLTGLVNVQTIRTAEMMDIRAIVFVRGKSPTEEVIELAKQKGIALLSTNNTLFYSCGKLNKAGL